MKLAPDFLGKICLGLSCTKKFTYARTKKLTGWSETTEFLRGTQNIPIYRSPPTSDACMHIRSYLTKSDPVVSMEGIVSKLREVLT